MDQTRDRPVSPAHTLPGETANTPQEDSRVGGAPISWGACEVPGWGPMPDADQVLDEMAQVGLKGTELGPPGFLPRQPEAVRDQLDRHGLELIGAFVPVVLHDRDLEQATHTTRETARLLSQAGGRILIVAAVEDEDWSPPRCLDDEGWRRLGAHASELDAAAAQFGVTLVLHPHVGTLIERAEDVQRALAATTVGWCLDTGHLLIGGTDPLTFAREHADRIAHVHLKDVDGSLAAEVRAGRLSLLEATRREIFLPLGRGDARVADVLETLRQRGYEGWLVVEQDTTLTADEPAVSGRPMLNMQESIAFVHNAAHESEEEIEQ